MIDGRMCPWLDGDYTGEWMGIGGQGEWCWMSTCVDGRVRWRLAGQVMQMKEVEVLDEPAQIHFCKFGISGVTHGEI